MITVKGSKTSLSSVCRNSPLATARAILYMKNACLRGEVIKDHRTVSKQKTFLLSDIEIHTLHEDQPSSEGTFPHKLTQFPSPDVLHFSTSTSKGQVLSRLKQDFCYARCITCFLNMLGYWKTLTATCKAAQRKNVTLGIQIPRAFLLVGGKGRRWRQSHHEDHIWTSPSLPTPSL